jgi:hypothetical protein
LIALFVGIYAMFGVVVFLDLIREEGPGHYTLIDNSLALILLMAAWPVICFLAWFEEGQP